MADPFDKILSDFQSSRYDHFTQQAIQWWRSTIRDLYGSEGAPVPPYKMASKWIQAYRKRYGRSVDRTPTSGKMYLFRYEPTTKLTLEYWDSLPLIIALEKKSGGFLGLNLHYLPKKRRGQLLNHMGNQLKNATDDDVEQDFKGEKLRNIRTAYRKYKVLKSKAAVFKWAYPCIRRYKFTGLKSNLIEIPVTDWELAAYLPSDYFFKGESVDYIQEDSINKKRKKFG